MCQKSGQFLTFLTKYLASQPLLLSKEAWLDQTHFDTVRKLPKITKIYEIPCFPCFIDALSHWCQTRCHISDKTDKNTKSGQNSHYFLSRKVRRVAR